MNGNGFDRITQTLKTIAADAQGAVSAPAELDNLLTFLETVVKVVHYSFGHAQTVLHQCEALAVQPLTPSAAGELKREIDQLIHRSWWNVHGVCDELKSLARWYDPTARQPQPGAAPSPPPGPPLRPVIDQLPQEHWWPILDLIRHQEGAVADLMDDALRQISGTLFRVMSGEEDGAEAAREVSRQANRRIDETQTAMRELQTLLADLRGAIGRVGGPVRDQARPLTAADELSGPDIASLRDALCDAFDQSGLDQMLRTRMNVDCKLWVRPGGLRDVAFELILKAMRTGRVAELVRAARQENPDNPALKAFADACPHFAAW